MAAAAATVSGLTASELAAVGAAASVAGAGVAAVGAMHQGEAAGNAAKFQSEVARNNAKVLEQNRIEAIHKGDVLTEQQGMKNAAIAGAIKASESASGVDVNTGSNAKVQKSERELATLDAETIRNNSAREAYGLEVAEQGEQSRADIEGRMAEYYPGAGQLSAAGTLLSTAGSVGSRYAMWRLSK